jgi:hypothetical protein
MELESLWIKLEQKKKGRRGNKAEGYDFDISFNNSPWRNQNFKRIPWHLCDRYIMI